MDQEGGNPCDFEVKKAFLKPKAPTADDPDSISPLQSDPSMSQQLSDEEIIESVYQSLLLIILSLQLQEVSAEVWCFDCCKTPPPSRVAETVPADTCPGAPMKLAKYSRTIDSGLRRKLF
ncbi:Uncharacterized protein Rs2_30930 [Raphanus sativus]|nr:Uncharacterized protein Rs2_30930 [Raphanus sativus]